MARYVLPVGLVFGRVTIDDILLDRVRHPEVARLRASMELIHDPALDEGYPARYSSVVEIRTRDGRTLSRRVDAARGTPENPVGPDEVRAKFRRLSAGVVPAARAEALRRAAEAIDRAPTVARLAALLRAPTRRA